MGRFSSSVAAFVPRSTFARSVALMSSATGLGQALAILAAPILTRLYSPDDFGLLGVYASILGIVSVIASLRYEQAVPLPGSDKAAINVLALAIAVVGATSLVVATGVFFYGPKIVSIAGAPEFGRILWWLPVGVALVGTYQALSFWAVRKQSYGRIAKTTLLQAGGSVSSQLGLGFFGAGAPGLIIGQVVGQSAGISSFATLVRAEPMTTRKAISFRRLKRVALRYRRFPLLFTWSALLNNVGLMGPTIVLAGYYGAAVVGWYTLVQRVLGMPTSLLGRSVTNVYFSESARLAREAPDELATLFRKLLKKLTLLGCVTILPAGLLSPWAFPLIFGKEWLNAGTYAMVLSPAFLLQFISSPFGVTLAVLERQDLALFREVVRVVLVAAALVLAYIGQFSPEQAIMSLAFAVGLSYLLHLYISWLAISQEVKKSGVS